MDRGGSGTLAQIVPPTPATTKSGDSGVVLSTQIVTQQPQILSHGAMDFAMRQPLNKLYMGEPLALGITQICIGIIGMAFGVMLNKTGPYEFSYVLAEIPLWTGLLYIISGSLSVEAARNPKIPMVKGMMAVNIVSAIAAGLGIILLSFSLEDFSTPWRSRDTCRYPDAELTRICCENRIIPHMSACLNFSTGLYKTVYGALAVLLLFTILEFCIAISTAAFGCKTVCRESYSGTVVVVYQNTIPDNAVSLPDAY